MYIVNIKNKMKRCFLIFFLCISLCSVAQVCVGVNQLNGTKWERVGPVYDNKEIYFEFTSSVMTDKVRYLKKNTVSEFKFYYYLSSSVPIAFDSMLVNKGTKGSFIVYYNHKLNKMYYYKIVSFTSDKLVLLRKGNPNSIGGGEDLYLTYKKVE